MNEPRGHEIYIKKHKTNTRQGCLAADAALDTSPCGLGAMTAPVHFKPWLGPTTDTPLLTDNTHRQHSQTPLCSQTTLTDTPLPTDNTHRHPSAHRQHSQTPLCPQTTLTFTGAGVCTGAGTEGPPKSISPSRSLETEAAPQEADRVSADGDTPTGPAIVYPVLSTQVLYTRTSRHPVDLHVGGWAAGAVPFASAEPKSAKEEAMGERRQTTTEMRSPKALQAPVPFTPMAAPGQNTWEYDELGLP